MKQNFFNRIQRIVKLPNQKIKERDPFLKSAFVCINAGGQIHDVLLDSS